MYKQKQDDLVTMGTTHPSSLDDDDDAQRAISTQCTVSGTVCQSVHVKLASTLHTHIQGHMFVVCVVGRFWEAMLKRTESLLRTIVFHIMYMILAEQQKYIFVSVYSLYIPLARPISGWASHIVVVVLAVFCPGGNLQFRKMKPMRKCLKPAFLLLICRGQLLWSGLYCMKVNTKMSLLLTWFTTSVNWFQRLLRS